MYWIFSAVCLISLLMEILLSFVHVAIIVLLVAIVAVLFIGVLTMGSGSRFTPEFSNKVMKIRVVLQGVIFFLVVIYASAQLFG